MSIRIPRGIRSERADKFEGVIKVKFTNNTEYVANLIWIYFHGTERIVKQLQTDEEVEIKCYRSFFFISEDAKTKKRLLLNKQLLYKPLSRKSLLFPSPLPVFPNETTVNPAKKRALQPLVIVPCRINTLDDYFDPFRPEPPVPSLFERCACVVLSCIHNREDLPNLKVPDSIQEKLIKINDISLNRQQELADLWLKKYNEHGYDRDEEDLDRVQEQADSWIRKNPADND